MDFYKNLKVKTKLIGSFLFMAMIVILIGGIGREALISTNNNAKEMYSINLQAMQKILSIKANLETINGKILLQMHKDHKNMFENAKTEIDEKVEENTTYIKEYEELNTSNE